MLVPSPSRPRAARAPSSQRSPLRCTRYFVCGSEKLLYSSILIGSHSPMSNASVRTSDLRRIHADFFTAPRLFATKTVDAESM